MWKCKKRLNAYQDPFGSTWLKVVPSKSLLKLTDQQLPISLSLRLGAKFCEKHTCRCGKLLEGNGHHGLSSGVSCARSAGRFSRHHNLDTLLKQALSSIKVPSILEPNGLTRTDGKCPDGITLAPWEEGKQLVWGVTCVDLLAPSRIENGSVANPGTDAEDAEELKTAKYVCLTDKGYISLPLAFEIQGGVRPSTSTFLKNLCKKLCVFNQENRTGSFFRQRLSLATQAGGGCKQVEFFWSKGQRSKLLIELQGSNGKWSLGLMPLGLKSFGLIQLVTWLNFFKPSVSGIGHLA